MLASRYVVAAKQVVGGDSYKALGMDPTLHLLDHQGRPTPVLEDPSPIHELF